MEAWGFIIRELKELSSFDTVMTEALEEYCEIDKVGAAADFARQAIIHDEGGFYLDLDFSVS